MPKIIYNKIIPFKGFRAINLFGVIFVRGDETDVTKRLLNHEAIHTAQMKELGYIPFYIIYFFEWLYKSFVYAGQGYRKLSFEQEAFNNQYNYHYLESRIPYAQWRKKS